MLARIWHGITASSKAAEYLEYLQKTGVSDYHATPGNLGVQILRRVEVDKAHFLIISFWESLEAIKGFAGDDPEKARYYPEDEDYLLEFEEKVTHYEVMARA